MDPEVKYLLRSLYSVQRRPEEEKAKAVLADAREALERGERLLEDIRAASLSSQRSRKKRQ